MGDPHLARGAMAKRFDEVRLLPGTLAAVRSFGFERMTPVQSASIPLFLENKDVCVEVRGSWGGFVVGEWLGADLSLAGGDGLWQDPGISHSNR